jgi:hypothetical protein
MDLIPRGFAAGRIYLQMDADKNKKFNEIGTKNKQE